MSELEQAKIVMPKLEFKKECPLCRQMWLTFPDDICPDCMEAKKKMQKGEVKTVNYDAIEPPFRVDIDG